ncbi:hypothetical protein MSG28_005231 [Choristoneura fumiferana]|uniref:Uncharacterized protein n=1 Tax=Choristoneura fumiferana TaxID=7141 RepID=A0ACC0JQE4_CHOFU|nr:hypothetical protein MSG28_005231 [Choristoneura fumiferana]
MVVVTGARVGSTGVGYSRHGAMAGGPSMLRRRPDDTNSAVVRINEDLKRIIDWSDANCLVLNPNKSKYILLGSKKQVSKVQLLDPKIAIGDVHIGHVDEARYWGWMSSMGPGELVEIGGRMNSERYLEMLKDVMLPEKQFEDGYKGYWGWMSSMGPGELVEIGGRMNSERYLEMLKDVMLPCESSSRMFYCQDSGGIGSFDCAETIVDGVSSYRGSGVEMVVEATAKLGGAGESFLRARRGQARERVLGHANAKGSSGETVKGRRDIGPRGANAESCGLGAFPEHSGRSPSAAGFGSTRITHVTNDVRRVSRCGAEQHERHEQQPQPARHQQLASAPLVLLTSPTMCGECLGAAQSSMSGTSSNRSALAISSWLRLHSYYSRHQRCAASVSVRRRAA